MALLLVLLPILGAVAALAIPSNRIRPLILPLTGFAHIVAVIFTMQMPEVEMFSQTLKLDPVGRVLTPAGRQAITRPNRLQLSDDKATRA